MFLLALASASAQERTSLVTDDTLARWEKELLPKIAATAGREFVEPPRLELVTLADARDRWARRHAAMRAAGWKGGEVTLFPANLSGVLGLYQGPVDGIEFITDNIEQVFVDARFEPKKLHTVMRCVVAHEMAHALQDQRAPLAESDDDEVTRVELSLREGHADYIAGKVCGAGSRYLDLVQGLDAPASRPADDPDAFAYGYAENFIAALDSVAGTEAVWATLSAPPPSRDVVTRIGRAAYPSGWTDARGLAAIANTIGSTAGAKIGPTSPGYFLAGLAGEEEHAADVAAVAGLAVEKRDSRQYLAVLAFLLQDEGAPADWLTRRTKALRAGQVFVLGGGGVLDGPPKVGGAPAARNAPGVTATLAAKMGFGEQYRHVEQWAARGRYLFGVVHRAERVDAKAIGKALAALLALHLPDVPEGDGLTDADRAVLRAMAPTTPVEPVVSWQYRRDAVLPDLLAKDWPGCVAHIEAALPTLADAGRSQLAEYGMSCAANAHDLAAQDRLYAEIHPPVGLDPETAVVYAEQLADAKRWKDVLAVLPAHVEGPSFVRSAAERRLQADVELGRWPEVAQLAAGGEASAQSRAWAASRMAIAGHRTEARPLLRAACPALDADNRAQCDRLLKQLGG